MKEGLPKKKSASSSCLARIKKEEVKEKNDPVALARKRKKKGRFQKGDF